MAGNATENDAKTRKANKKKAKTLGGTVYFQQAKSWLIWAAFGAFSPFVSAHAATEVSGPITANATWTLSQSPYVVMDDILVENGATLTIEPGVMVRFNVARNLTIQAGALKAQGTEQSPILFTSVKDDGVLAPAPGDWGQIRLLGGTIDVATVLDHVRVAYGHGILIESASPTLNRVDIANNAAAAITIDLNSSPVGSGNSASGNTLNGISVLPGNIGSSVAWRLKGLPYVVSQGSVSIGQPPAIAATTPNEIQQGETLEMILSGSRLQGVERITFGDTHLTALVLDETEATVRLRVTAPASAPIGLHGIEVLVAAGIARLDGALNVTAPKPAVTITSIEPASIRVGETKTFTVTGANFDGVRVSTSDPGLVINQVVVATDGLSLSLSLTALSSLSAGTQTLTFTNNSVSGATASIDLDILAPPPSLHALPAPLGVPPDAKARQFTLKLAAPDTVDHTISLAVVDSAVAAVSPLSVVILAGQTEATFALSGSKVGETRLLIGSMTLGSTTAPVYVLSEFANPRATIAKPLGVVFGEEPPKTTTITPASMALGVVVAEDVLPQSQLVNSLPSLALGIVVEETVTGSPMNVNSLAGAQLGVLVEETAIPINQDVLLAGARLGVAVDFVALSIEPTTMAINTSGTLMVRGVGLNAATAVKLFPADGITLGTFQVSADGSQITVPITVAAGTAATARAVVLETASGRIEFADPAASQLLLTAQ